eukprot:CAMPEP_0172151378 /NCGR_PEP_ID=MMETSP1050-20130122/196_1 /TAXON_ID=233186 /ORGANISM="Cryptomonas curvata, Strain CCAP979/52" /LENGTH=102 /DNA_ID=CAMNT_0012819477 /DNA_START=83 /DNA_END=391 /DNA_ORIENTATION=-
MNAVRTLASKVTPIASRRALSTTASTPSAASFKDIWAVGEAVPLVVMVTIPSLFAVYTVSRFAMTHTECQWSKTTKSKSVAGWYEEKYPGTKSHTTAGARYH